MNKTVVVFASIFALLLSACLPNFNSTPAAGPTVDTAGTSAAQFNTAVALTLTAQPTLPIVSATDTATAPVVDVTDTLAPTETAVTLPNLTLTPTAAANSTSGTVVATSSPINLATFTPTLAAGQVTASPTLGIRTYGTLPPEVPFAHVILVNRANVEAYISLQVTMPDGKYSIIEYPVEGTIKIKAPIGQYVYVTWVGGNKMIGNFRLHENEDIVITLYKKKVVIK